MLLTVATVLQSYLRFIMAETRDSSIARKALARSARLSEIARLLLHGPRSVMFPDDPDGRSLWLEPVIKMKANAFATRIVESLIVYSVPNCLVRSLGSTVLIRHAKWESQTNWESSGNGSSDWPSIGIVYTGLAKDATETVDRLITRLDESLKTFSFPVEGLDLSGPSGFKPLPDDAVITTHNVDLELCRTTRFSYIELRWSPVQGSLTKLDESWNILFKSLVGLSVGPFLMPGVGILEKYDIDPKRFAECLSAEL